MFKFKRSGALAALMLSTAGLAAPAAAQEGTAVVVQPGTAGVRIVETGELYQVPVARIVVVCPDVDEAYLVQDFEGTTEVVCEVPEAVARENEIDTLPIMSAEVGDGGDGDGDDSDDEGVEDPLATGADDGTADDATGVGTEAGADVGTGADAGTGVEAGTGADVGTEPGDVEAGTGVGAGTDDDGADVGSDDFDAGTDGSASDDAGADGSGSDDDGSDDSGSGDSGSDDAGSDDSGSDDSGSDG